MLRRPKQHLRLMLINIPKLDSLRVRAYLDGVAGISTCLPESSCCKRRGGECGLSDGCYVAGGNWQTISKGWKIGAISELLRRLRIATAIKENMVIVSELEWAINLD